MSSAKISKMIDGSEKRKRQLAFELQNSRVFKKGSKQYTSTFLLFSLYFWNISK